MSGNLINRSDDSGEKLDYMSVDKVPGVPVEPMLPVSRTDVDRAMRASVSAVNRSFMSEAINHLEAQATGQWLLQRERARQQRMSRADIQCYFVGGPLDRTRKTISGRYAESFIEDHERHDYLPTMLPGGLVLMVHRHGGAEALRHYLNCIFKEEDRQPSIQPRERRDRP